MLACTKQQLIQIVALTRDILGEEHPVDIQAEAEEGRLFINIQNRLDTHSLYGEQAEEGFVRSVCWLAARQIISGLNPTEVIVEANLDPRPPNLAEMAYANAIECHREKTLAARHHHHRIPDITPRYGRYLELMNGMSGLD